MVSQGNLGKLEKEVFQAWASLLPSYHWADAVCALLVPLAPLGPLVPPVNLGLLVHEVPLVYLATRGPMALKVHLDLWVPLVTPGNRAELVPRAMMEDLGARDSLVLKDPLVLQDRKDQMVNLG